MPMGVVNPADAEEMSSCKSKLFLIVADQGRDSLLSSQLRNTPVIAIPSELVLLGAEVCKHLCASLPILTTSTDAPSSGKTQAVMRLAHDKQLRFASAITDGSAGCFVDQVTTVMRGRVNVDEPILLHISVSHGARGCRINDQLLEYAVLGRLAEHHGKAALRHPTDTIVVEIPSQGKLHTTFRTEAPALQWFQHLWVPDRIQLTLFHLSAPPQGELATRTLHVVEPDFVTNQRLHKAMGILSAYMEASLSRKQRLKHFEDLDDVFCSDDANLAGLILNFCPEKYRNDFGAILRFTRLLTVLLCGIHDFQLYRTASAALEREDILGGGTMPQHRMHNYRALAYFLVKYSIESATELAATSVPAATDESSDESSRLDGLDLTFDNLRCSFLLFTRDTYEFITTKHDDDDLIATFNKRWNKRNESDYDWDSDFHAMALDIHHRQDITVTQALRSIHRDGDGFHYKEFQRILPVLGLHANFGLHLINAIEKAELLNIAMETSFSVAVVTCSALISGCHELRRVSKDWVRVLETDTATVGDFFQHTQEWLQSLTSSSKSKSQPFVLTSDSFVRLLAVKTRLLCGIPVVFQGETGQGKTHLLKHMSRVSGTIFEVINIHRGLEASALLTKIQAVEASLRSLMANEANESPIAIVVLDEVNSMRDVWVAKALVCDRILLGRTIMPEIHFVCIMNPWRRQESQITPGLDFVSANDDGLQTGSAGVRQQNLVYDVNRSPESFMCVVWDFGLAHNSVETREYVQNHLWGERASVPAEWNAVTDEHIFAESCFSWHLQKMNSASSFDGCWRQLREAKDNNGNRHFKYLRTLFVILTDSAQKEMRRIGGVCSVSLRDIHRTVSLFPFLYDVQVHYHACHYVHNSAANSEEPFRLLQRALSASFVMNYLLRLPDAHRVEVENVLLERWRVFRHQVSGALDREFLVAPNSLYDDADNIAEKVCECLVIDEGMAVNNALKENVLSLFCSIMHPIGNLSQIIAGRPGSTKSASLDALVVSSDRACTDHRSRFFKSWKPIKKFVVQCTRETTAQAILRVAKSAATHQRMRDSIEPVQCVLVLEEVGIAVNSKHNPLMVLHSLIDTGVVLDDGTVVRIPIIGISNYSLDAAKMNRMRITFRGNPRLDDLKHTARTLMRQQARKVMNSSGGAFQSYTVVTSGGVDAVVNEQWVDGFCVAFRNLILQDNLNPHIRWFYGMRDFYSFVSMMKRHIDNRLGDEIGQSLLDNRRKSSFLHLMQWALQINFGGHPDPDIEKTVIQTLSKAILGNGSTLSICAWEPASTALPTTTTTGLGVNTAVCDMCARLQWYDARVRDPTTEFNLVTYVKTGTPCPTIINHQATVRSSLVYALYRTPPEVVRLYRVRNVLLFSRGNAGVELLFRLGYVHKDAEVIDPRDPAHVTPQQIMTDLSRVRRCLRTNRTLILVRAAHLYEAMFDVLNQHFAIEPRGDEYCFYSTLTVDGFTSTVRVSPDHRIILVEDEANINKLTAPFLNRCIKVHLDFESALSAPQRRLFNHVKADVEHHGNCVPKMLIPGYSDETLASHILNIDVAPDASQSTVRSLVGDVWGWLWTLVCPRRWHQARLGLIPQITEEAISKWCCNPIGSELEHLIRRPHIVTTSNDDDYAGTGAAVTENNEVLGEDEEEVDGIKLRQHLLVFTEQREIPGRQLIETMLRLFGAQRCDPSKIVPINFLQDDALDPLISGTVGTSQNNATVGIFVVDMSAINGDAGSVKLDGLLHRVARCSQHRHIVVVAVLPSTSKPPTVSDTSGFGRLTWRLSDRSDWTLIFLDEVVPPESLPVDPHLLVPASESDDYDDNDEEAADQEYDDADKSLTDADDEEDDDVYDAKDMIRLQFALRQAFAAVGTMRSRAIAQHLGSGESVKLLERAVVSLFDLKTPAFDCLADMFVAGMKMLPVMASNPAWTKLAILTVASSDSLRDQLTTFLVNLGQRAAQLVIPVLMEENSHYHAGSGAAEDHEVGDDDDDAARVKGELRDVFTALLHSSLVPTVDYAECIQQQGQSLLALPPTSIQLVNDVCRFPFSLRLQQKLDTAETTEVQRAIYDSLFMSLARAPSAELVRLYSADLVRRASKLSFAECDVIASLLLLNVADYNSLTIVDVHAHLSSHSQWLDCAYEWVRGLSALALDDARVTLRAWALEHHAPLDDDDDDGDEASHLRKNNTDDDDSTGEDEEQVEEDETQFPGFYITILRCCQRKLIDVAAAQSPHGIIPLSKVNAIAGLCPQLRDCWDLKLHSGLAMLPPAADRELIGTGYDDIKGFLACKKPSDVIRYVFDHYSPVIDLVIHSLVLVVLPPEEENTSASMTLRTALVDHAVGCEGFPHALWASVLRSLIRKWRDNPGTTLDTFIGPALTYHVHSNPDSERSSVVSRCFFDVWHESGYQALQSKISSAISSIDAAATSAAAEQLQNSSPLLTLLRVARSGIDTAASSVLASQLLLTSDPAVTNHQGRVDRRVTVAETYLKTAYESNDSYRKEQISWFLCRAVYFQVLSMAAFRAALAADRRKPVSLIPSKFYTSFESLALLTAVPPPSSVLDLFDGYAQTRVNLERALPPTSRIGSPPTRTIVAAALSISVTSPQHERLPMDAYLTPLLTTLAEKLRVELSQKSNDIIDAILFAMTLSATIPFLFNAQQADSDVQPVYARGPPPPAEERQATAAFFAAQALDRIAGILQALCRDNNGATQRVSVADVRAASEHVIDQILPIRCPHCRAPFDGFEGCFAITCMCDQDFCGWCYEMSEDSLANHVHVLACPFGLNGRGHFYGTVVQWAESNTRWRVQKLQAYFNTIDDGALRSAIAGNLLPQLLALGIDIGTVGANPIVSAKTLIGDLEPVLKQLSTSLFGNANGTSNAVWWLCSKIVLVVANNNGNSAQQFHTWDDVLAHFTTAAGENPLEWVAERQAATTNTRSPAINTLLQLPPILETEALLPEQERRQWLHRHYRYRSVFDATKAFWSVVESNNSFAALKRLHQASSAIPQYLCATQNEAYCRILQFVKKLQVAARRHHLTRATAETTTLQHWNSTHPFVAERELEQLESDVRLIWSCVEDVFCKTKRDLIGADVATDVFEVSTARVSSMLPGSSFTDKNGGFILALLHGRSHASGWQGLFESSNNVQQVLQEHNVPQGPNAHHRLFSLQPSDLLEYDEHTLVTTVLPMFIDPTAPASGFTHDVAAKVVQWSLSQPGIHGKPSLLPVLDDHPALMEGAVEAFKYADEVSSSVITLQQKLPFELITEESGIEAAIQELIRYDPEFADAARSFISVLIRELASCSVRIQLPVLAEAAYKSMATPLLPIQSRAAFAIFSRLGTRLRTSHLVPLLTLVWNMDNIVPSARQPFPEHSSIPVQVTTVVKKFVHDERIQVVLRFLAVLRIACVMYLQPTNVFSEHYFDSSLMDVVYSVKEEKAFEDFAALEDSHTLPYMHETICCVKQSLEDALQEAADIRRVQEYQQSQLQANDDHAASHDNHRIHSLNLAAAQQRSTNFIGVAAMTPRMNLDGRSGGGGFVLRSAVALGDSQDSRATTAGASGRDRSSGGRHSDGHPQATATNVTNMWLVDPCLNYGDV